MKKNHKEAIKIEIMEEARRISKRIAALRDRLGLGNREIGEALDLTEPTIKAIMSGGGGTIQFAKLKRLANVLKTTPNEILGVNHTANLDALWQGIKGSYVWLGLDDDEADALVQLVREACEEQLSASALADQNTYRRALVESATQKFLKAKRILISREKRP